MKDILVLTEVIENKVQDIDFELFGKAKELAGETGGKSIALVMGNDVDTDLPCDAVYYVEDEMLRDFSSLHNKVAEKVIGELKPKVVMAGNTSLGTDMAVYIAAALEYPIASLCSNVSIEGNNIRATSVAYGGKLLVDVELEEKGVILVNRGSFSMGTDGSPSEVKKIALDELGVETDESIKFMSYIRPEEDVDISKFDILVSVGRGIDGEENIEEAKELAEILGAEISASRPVIDSGWLPKSRQVGRSGKTVSPKLYLALGISGASEHLEGVKAKNVIAVNTDPDAPIFRVSRVGAVIDIFELLPELIEKLEEIKG